MHPLPRRSFLRSAVALLPAATLARTLAAAQTATAPTPLPTLKPLAREEDRYAVKRALPNGTTTFNVSSAAAFAPRQRITQVRRDQLVQLAVHVQPRARKATLCVSPAVKPSGSTGFT